MIEGKDSPELRQVLEAIPAGLARLCIGQNIDPMSFSEMTIVFEQSWLGMSATTRVAAHIGEVFVDTYVGTPLQRARVRDHLGRIRTAR